MHMNRIWTAALILAVTAGSAHASGGQTRKELLKLGTDARIGGVELKAGSYKLVWTGTGPEVEVAVNQGKTTLVTVRATVSELKQKAMRDSVQGPQGKDGLPEIAEVSFANDTTHLKLGEPVTAGTAPRAEDKRSSK